MQREFNCLIMGAAGRDFHDFQTFFKTHPEFRVRAFTATQIPFIASRSFPRSLAGPGYDADIPIYAEQVLPELIDRFDIDFVFLSYSDLSHVDVMHKASLVQACGAAFALLGPRQTQIRSRRPVISITAVRTGAGKSPLAQWLARQLVGSGRRVAVIRHPMPYGDLTRQRVQRFERLGDLNKHDCTVEEREEFEPYLEQGQVVFAGLSYQAVLEAAESESDVIVWDGGNNDYAFIRPDLSLVVVDALRAGHETTYYPGETNLRAADVIVISKADQVERDVIDELRRTISVFNPRAEIAESALDLQVDDAVAIDGKRVLVVEDGPTLTHGGMSWGAGTLAAHQFGARVLIDPRTTAVGSIAATFAEYPHLHRVLPAMGYSAEQQRELADTILASGAELIVDASPARISRLLKLNIPVVSVRYQFRQLSGPELASLVAQRITANGAR